MKGKALSALVAILGAALLLGGSCAEENGRGTTPDAIQEAELPRADVRLVVLTDLDGYLEPCGCTSRPLGGIDRMAARLRQLREDRVPTVLVGAGNLFFSGAPHGADAERGASQEIWKAEAIVDILERLELSAATPGPLDFAFGTDVFVRLAEAADFPLLAAGVQVAEAESVFVPTTVVEAGDIELGIVGVSDLRGTDGANPERVTAPEDLRAAAREAVAAVRARGADLVVALVQGDRRTARRLADGLEGVDFVVHGGLDAQDVSPPSEVGESVLVQAGRHGRGLVVLDLVRRGEGSWTDASAWTRRSRREHLEGQIEELRARIAEWERDSDVAREDVERQRARLASLSREAGALARPPALEGNVFSARYDELPPEAPRDRTITQMLARYDRRVNEHNQRAFADWLPEAAPEGRPEYVGSATCASCHGAAVAWWRTTRHGNAYATLEERNKNFNLSCVGCHVTGYLRPGGSTVTHVERLTNVGCESCHGPGSMHVADPQNAPVNVVRSPAETTCIGCHNEEHSDRFHFDTYRRLMIAPGHGMPP